MNIGDSPGTITGSTVSLGYHSAKPYLRDIAPNSVIKPRRFKPGATDFYVVRGDEASGLAWASDVFAEDKALYFFGWLVYEDELKTPRTMYFCRHFSDARERFVPVEDPDYEATY